MASTNLSRTLHSRVPWSSRLVGRNVRCVCRYYRGVEFGYQLLSSGTRAETVGSRASEFQFSKRGLALKRPTDAEMVHPISLQALMDAAGEFCFRSFINEMYQLNVRSIQLPFHFPHRSHRDLPLSAASYQSACRRFRGDHP
jgi:hypothetical protein